MGEGNAERARDLLGHSRWWLVAAAVAMMAVVGPYQYVWTAIESPIAQRLDVPLPQIGLVFTLFVVFQAGSQFPVGWWRDRHGPRRISLLAGLLAGGGYLGTAWATEVWQLYLSYSLGAVGVGIVYTVAVNTALKWFPDRRGLTTGLGTMAFAGGSAAFVPYVRANATAAGYPAVLRNMGLLIGAVVVVGALVLRDPPRDWRADPAADGGSAGPAADDEAADDEAAGPADDERGPEAQADRAEPAGVREEAPAEATGEAGADAPAGGRTYTSREMLRTWQFWLMYAMFVGMSGAGLMLTAKVVSFAENLALTAVTATAAATLLPLSGGVGRLVLGELSDRLDRRRAMVASFTLCGVGLFAVVGSGLTGASVAFVAAVVVATFFWSPQYTLFPSIVADYYGERHSSANYALLYSGKMWGGVFGGAVAGWLVTVTGWTATFLVGGGLAVAAGLAALVLRPPAGAGPGGDR